MKHPTALLLAVLAAASGCNRVIEDPPQDGLTVDARVYAGGFCSLKCYRLEQCGQHPASDCEDACIDEALAMLPTDPCWEHWIEVRRCGVRWAECADVEEEAIPASAAETCAPKVARLDTCERE